MSPITKIINDVVQSVSKGKDPLFEMSITDLLFLRIRSNVHMLSEDRTSSVSERYRSLGRRQAMLLKSNAIDKLNIYGVEIVFKKNIFSVSTGVEEYTFTDDDSIGALIATLHTLDDVIKLIDRPGVVS